MTPKQISDCLKIRSQALKKIRKSKKISVFDLSQKTGLSRNTIATMENGSSGWSVLSEIIYLDFLTSLP